MKSFKPTCWSEYGELEVVMLCSPTILDIPDMSIAEDVQWSAPVDSAKAHENFAELKASIEAEGAVVIDYCKELTEEENLLNEQLINRVFVRDLACVYGDIIIPGEAGSSMRKPEYVQAHSLLKKWFPEQFIVYDEHKTSPLEHGDVFVLNRDAVFMNVGMRTSIASIDRIKDKLFSVGFSEIGLIDLPRRTDTLHLDMNCNVANDNLIISKSYLRYLPVRVVTESTTRYEMSETFLKRHGFGVYWLSKYDTIPDINFLNINPETLLISSKAHKQMIKNHPLLQKKRIIEVDVTELEKGGGGIRCMTLPLKRKNFS